MGLKGSRQVSQTGIEVSVSGVAARGGVLSYVPGVAGLAEYSNAAAVSGQLAKPLGILMDDVEDINYFRSPEFRNRNVVAKGSVVGYITEGDVWTDFVETTTADGASVGTYAPGDTLYLANDGKVSRLNVLGRRPVVGAARSTIGSDGYIKIRVEL
mgnify:CR=1 FL=1